MIFIVGMADTPADRLRRARIDAGYPDAASAARAFGWNEHTYKSHENGTRGLKLFVARKYAQAFRNTSAAELLTGTVGSAAVGPAQVITVPVLGVVSAGMFRDADWRPEDTASVPAINVAGAPPDAQYALLVEGPSVNKRIAPGMYAIVVRHDAYGDPHHGQLVHCARDRAGLVENTIKELRYGPGGLRSLWPVSTHPDHQEPLDLDTGEEDLSVTIRGVVIGKFEPI